MTTQFETTISMKKPPEVKSDEALLPHFEGFVKSFIARRFQSRWRHILIEKPTKARVELVRFELQCNEERCHLIKHADWLALLKDKFADGYGVFFDGRDPAMYLSGTQIVARLSKELDDSLWSIKPGKSAFVFSHDGYGWRCGKK